MESNRKRINAYNASQPEKNNSETVNSADEFLEKKGKSSDRTPPVFPGLVKKSGEWNTRKVAKLLILLGPKKSVKIFRHLSRAQIEDISREIATISHIDKIERSQILSDFGMAVQNEEILPQGGIETARGFLKKAFGEEKGEKILHQAVPESAPVPFSFFQDLPPMQQLLLVKEETPAIIAIILSFLPPKTASVVIKKMEPQKGKQVLLRLARMKTVDKEIVQRIENSLKERIKAMGTLDVNDFDGKNALADILRHLPVSREKVLLKEIGEEDPLLSQEVSQLMFTEESVLKILDRDMETELREYSDAEIALLLRHSSEDWKEKIKSNLSARRLSLIEEEIETNGPKRKSEINSAVDAFIEQLRYKVENGKARLEDEDNPLV